MSMKTDIHSFRTALAQASSFGLAPPPGMIWTASQDFESSPQTRGAWTPRDGLHDHACGARKDGAAPCA